MENTETSKTTKTIRAITLTILLTIIMAFVGIAAYKIKIEMIRFGLDNF